MIARIKLPAGWEKCRTGRKGVRKWRNMRTGCWVTDRIGDDALHVGVHNTPLKYPRAHYTIQQAIDCIEATTLDYEEETGVKVDFSRSSKP